MPHIIDKLAYIHPKISLPKKKDKKAEASLSSLLCLAPLGPGLSIPLPPQS